MFAGVLAGVMRSGLRREGLRRRGAVREPVVGLGRELLDPAFVGARGGKIVLIRLGGRGRRERGEE